MSSKAYRATRVNEVNWEQIARGKEGCSRSRQRCNILYSMRGVRHRADPLTGVLSPIRWDVE